MFDADELDDARRLVAAAMPPTPQYRWPVLDRELGLEVWVKHENHAPTGAFKVRGGVVHLQRRRAAGLTNGVISATRGNHGQSLAFAAGQVGVPATIVVPYGNSVEKNAAMRALGAELIEDGRDFDEARAIADDLAESRGLDFVPSFHPDLVVGVATYAHELLTAVRALDVVYVPIGLGSGICGVIGARDVLGLDTEVVGVVADVAPAYAESFAAGRVVTTESALTFADGMAVRSPDADALEVILRGAARVVRVSEDQIADAMRLLFRATHNVAEGAGAGALAAVMHERAALDGQRVGVILTGGNIDADRFATVLTGGTPPVA